MRWPDPVEVMLQLDAWVGEQATRVPSLEQVAIFGSDGRGTAGVGSDLNLLLIDAQANGPQHMRQVSWPLERLPLSGDALVLKPDGYEALMTGGSRFAAELQRDSRWLWSRPSSVP